MFVTASITSATSRSVIAGKTGRVTSGFLNLDDFGAEVTERPAADKTLLRGQIKNPVAAQHKPLLHDLFYGFSSYEAPGRAVPFGSRLEHR